MNKHNHTSGPITVRADTQPWQGFFLYDVDDNCIGGTALHHEQDRANAVLWAASPDLLAALESMIAAYESRPYIGTLPCVNLARDAITKAKREG